MAKRYLIPVEENEDGKRTLLWDTILKGLILEPKDSIMIYFTPDQPVATLYVFEDMSQVAAWMQKDKTSHIAYIEPKQEEPVVTGEVIETPPTEA